MGRLRKAHYNASEDMKDVEKAVAIGILGERMDRFLAVVYDVADLLREPITEVDTGVMERKGQSPQGHIRETLDYENRMVETSGGHDGISCTHRLDQMNQGKMSKLRGDIHGHVAPDYIHLLNQMNQEEGVQVEEKRRNGDCKTARTGWGLVAFRPLVGLWAPAPGCWDPGKRHQIPSPKSLFNGW